MPDRILIIGMGNAGYRHAVNARSLGMEVIAYDPRFSFLEEIEFVQSLPEGFKRSPLFAIVATPPEDHYSSAFCVAMAGIPCLVEKPPVTSLRDMHRLVWSFLARNLPFGVGYQMRQMPSLRSLRRRVATDELGTIWSARFEFASADWKRPGTYEPHVLLECSHELDLITTFFGPAKSVVARGDRRSCSMFVEFIANGAAATVHLDTHSKEYRRRFVLYGQRDSAEWVFDERENEAAYLDELSAFADVCRGKPAYWCSGQDCLVTVELMELAMREIQG